MSEHVLPRETGHYLLGEGPPYLGEGSLYLGEGSLYFGGGSLFFELHSKEGHFLKKFIDGRATSF